MSSLEGVQLVEKIGQILCQQNKTLGTAESCTGGMIGETITSVAGSSAYYEGGIISYSNEVKENILGVPRNILDSHGAVSHEVAYAMAEGVRHVLHTDYSISTTGIAGPGGATNTKPVGLVYIGVSTPSGVKTFKYTFKGNRQEVRVKSVIQGLTHLLAELQSFGEV